MGSGRAKILAAGCSLLLAGTLVHAQSTGGPTHPKTKAAASHHSKSHTPATSSTKKTSTKGKKPGKTANWRKRGQQKIDSQRAREIQEALIREHYLDGKATGTWNDASQKAMERFQADNGWQSKSVPDSRALIKLGLGPDHQHLLNPESAMTTMPAAEPQSKGPSSSSNSPQK
ncbi:MAG: peptidoglycan-binding protein [Acidobacteriia bacterium]|nr:peptidoglycan-binding protein [Terriglobia bacterium]